MNILNYMISIVLLFVIAIAIITGQYFYDSIDGASVFSGSQEAQDAYAVTGNTLGVLNTVFIVLVLAVGIGSIIAAYYVSSNPAFFLVLFPINAVIVILASVFSNAFDALIAGGYAGAANQQTLIVLVLRNFPVITVVFAFIALILAYSKTGTGGMGGRLG